MLSTGATAVVLTTAGGIVTTEWLEYSFRIEVAVDVPSSRQCWDMQTCYEMTSTHALPYQELRRQTARCPVGGAAAMYPWSSYSGIILLYDLHNSFRRLETKLPLAVSGTTRGLVRNVKWGYQISSWPTDSTSSESRG